jgi:hypothetical protein
MKKQEHAEQVALFKWIELAKGRVPELALMFAIPNQSQGNIQRGRYYKAEGQKAGVPDTMLPVARRGYHGLFIEMKRSGGKPSEAQLMWKAWLKEQGYLSLICVGAEDAIDKLSWYVGLA